MRIILRYDSSNVFVEKSEKELLRFTDLTDASQVVYILRKVLEKLGFSVEEYYES